MAVKTIVVSAVNIRRGGTLKILRDCLSYLSTMATDSDFRIVAIVHDKELVKFDGIEYIEMPTIIKSWGKRLWCEYVTMHKISKKLFPVDLWLSLHDTTPRVLARKQAMYCQTSFPFLKLRWRDIIFDYKIVLFGFFTYFAYRINVYRNNHIIVQADWLKQKFSRMLNVKPEAFIVAPPQESDKIWPEKKMNKGTYDFLYVSIADCHKNIEEICRAAEILEKEVGTDKFNVYLTIDGTENRYSRWIYRTWGHVKSIKFLGYLTRQEVDDHYANAECVIFPSRIETWGLPISEFRSTGKPMLLANLPYAHEASIGCEKVAFFNPDDPNELAGLMKELLINDESSLHPVVGHSHCDDTKIYGWNELFECLLK